MTDTPDPGTLPNLRTRRRRQLISEVQQVALRLVERNGFAATTVDEIAGAAGISQRTFFRYFPTKEDAILAGNRIFDEMIDELDVSGHGLGSLAALERMHQVRLESLTAAEIEALRTIQCLIEREPALQEAAAARDLLTQNRILEHLAQAWPDLDPLTGRIVVEVAAATLRAAILDWRTGPALSGADLTQRYQRARRVLRDLVASSTSP